LPRANMPCERKYSSSCVSGKMVMPCAATNFFSLATVGGSLSYEPVCRI
jgi:hypothetical protein